MKDRRTMNSSVRFKIGLILPFLVLVCLFTAFWATNTLTTSDTQPNIRRPVDIVEGDFEFFYLAHTVISTVNIILLIALLFIFINVYKKTRSEFSFGLIIFGIAFLLKDITASPFIANAFSFYPSGLGPFIVLPDLFEFAILTTLLYLHIKY